MNHDLPLGKFTSGISIAGLLLCLWLAFYSITGWVREPDRWIEWLLGVVFFGCGVVVLTVMISLSARRQPGKTAGIALTVCCLLMGAGPMLVFRDDFLAVLAGAVVIAAGVVGFIRTLRSS